MRPSKHLLAAIATVAVATAPVALAQNAPAPSAPAAPAPIVKSIDVQYAGPNTISKARILANMRTAVGRPYSDMAVDEDIRNLYNTGNVTNVRIFGEPVPDGVKVVVVIQTKSVVKEIQIEGVSEFKTKAIRKQLTTKPGDQLTEANLETDRQKILDYYLDHGYKDTGVQFRVDADEKTNKSVVVFTVTEAAKTIVKSIQFEGNTHFKAGELRKTLKTKTENILSFFTKAGTIKSGDISDDVVALREFYQNHGYLDVQVSDPQVERVGNKVDVKLIFAINEGQQYHSGKIAVIGTQLFSADEVEKSLTMKQGMVYSPKGVSGDVKVIQDMYGARGYIDAQVVPETASAGTAMTSVTFKVDEGSQSYINRINITGNTRTKDKVIRRELAVSPGQVYDSVRVDASKDRLKNLNYFERVDTYPSETMTPGKKDLNVVVQEKRTGSLNFGAGFSSVDNLIGFVELTQSNFDITNWPNFTGGGQRFRARIQYGTERSDAVISFTEPYFLDYQLAVGGELFYHDATYLSTVYSQRDYGFNTFIRKAINQFTSIRFDYKLDETQIYDVTTQNPAITSQEGHYLQSQIGPALVYDTRDSIFLTRKGTRVSFSSYIAGGPLGGDVDIYGGDLEATHYFSLPWDTILTIDGELGSVATWNNGSQVPIFDRLYLGGSGNLRGFKYRDVGPKDGPTPNSGDPIGGDSLARVTVEYTFPVMDRVRGAVFYDGGFVNAGSYSYGLSDYSDDVGIGVRLDLPIGPVRLDYGIPMQHPTSNAGGHFNFNIGYQF